MEKLLNKTTTIKEYTNENGNKIVETSIVEEYETLENLIKDKFVPYMPKTNDNPNKWQTVTVMYGCNISNITWVGDSWTEI
jgi:hypothetical protein